MINNDLPYGVAPDRAGLDGITLDHITLDRAVGRALDALREGRPVLVTDSTDRENEGDVILAAATTDERWLAWTIRHTSGFVCAPMPDSWADRLQLPPMVATNRDRLGTAYTVSFDAGAGVTTGISAADRARTLRLIADPTAAPGDLNRPGHVVGLRARDGGVLERAGHTEAAVDLCRLAGLAPVAAIAELVHDDGTMLRHPDVVTLAAQYDLPVLTIAELIAWRQRHDRVEAVATTTLPTPYGIFTVTGYRDLLTGAEHLALVSPRGLGSQPVVRLHSECLTGDVFGSQRCDCGPQLELALSRVADEGGCVIYLRGHEGRGIGLTAKLRAYQVQDTGLDTVDAQVALGLPIDAREYAAGGAILESLGVTALTLLTNNPAKSTALHEYGFAVTTRAHEIPATPTNRRYLQTKRDRLGHAVAADTTPSPDPGEIESTTNADLGETESATTPPRRAHQGRTQR